ncbi:MAG: HAD-IIA family hydrolase [Ilumatobacteraceae bacterium]|nr:HAD-IIA family hydrolase [Ilumatobacteraceae bacterium]
MAQPADTHRAQLDDVAVILCDLDGVVWLSHEAIEGSVEAVDRMRADGRRVVFVTNNSAPRLADHEAALGAIGIDARGAVVSSSMAAARLIERGERVLISGGPGVAEAVQRRGAEAVRNDGNDDRRPCDAVVIGIDRSFDYQRLAWSARVVREGARLIATNGDATYPTPRGPEPGGGSLVAALEVAAGVDAVVAGKPEAPMAALIVDDVLGGAADRALMVGDRPETDGLFAARLGCPYAQVRSGVVAPGERVPPGVAVALDVADLAAVARSLIN